MCVHNVSEVFLSSALACLSIYIYVQGCLVQSGSEMGLFAQRQDMLSRRVSAEKSPQNLGYFKRNSQRC